MGQPLDDHRVRVWWIFRGRMDQALPELRAFSRQEAERIWKRADHWAFQERRVWCVWIALGVVYGLIILFMVRWFGDMRLPYWTSVLPGLALFIIVPGTVFAGRLLTLSRLRWHLRLEIGTLCPDCGYDLRGGHLNWEAGLSDRRTGKFNCPECGMELRRVYREEPEDTVAGN